MSCLTVSHQAKVDLRMKVVLYADWVLVVWYTLQTPIFVHGLCTEVLPES